MPLARKTELVPLKSLMVDPSWNARQVPVPEAELAALGQDLRLRGQLHPLVVWTDSERSKRPFLIAGFRRFAAAKAAGMKEILVLPFSGSEEDARAINLKENLARSGLRPGEVAPHLVEWRRQGKQLKEMAALLASTEALDGEPGSKLSGSYLSNLLRVESGILDERVRDRWRRGRGGVNAFLHLVKFDDGPAVQAAYYNEAVAPSPEDMISDHGSTRRLQPPARSPRPNTRTRAAALRAIEADSRLSPRQREDALGILSWVLGKSPALRLGGRQVFPVLEDSPARPRRAPRAEKTTKPKRRSR